MSKCIKVEALGIGYANPDVFKNKAYAEGWNSAVKIIKEAEIIDAEPVRHGRWEEAIRTRRSIAGKIDKNRTVVNIHTATERVENGQIIDLKETFIGKENANDR